MEDRTVPSGGALDAAFGSGGTATTNFGSNDAAHAVVIQPDGKIIAAGLSTNPKTLSGSLDVARYNPNGTLDTSFGSRGQATNKITQSRPSGTGVALQPDGKIVTVTAAGGYAIVERLTAAGILDKTFNGTGQVFTSYGTNTGVDARAVAIETVNGVAKIVVAGGVSGGPGVYSLALTRYNLDGSLDASFGSGGKALHLLPEGGNFGYFGLAVQPDGKIVAVGTVDQAVNGFTVARYNVDGTLDAGFGADGTGLIFNHAIDGVAAAVVIQPDGKIVAGGWGTYAPSMGYDFALVRYNGDGSLDMTFSGGVVQTTVTNGPDYLFGLALQSDGKVVATGSSGYMVRYNPDGTLDTGFGAGGVAPTAGGNALAIQSDGKIVTVGVSGGGDFIVGRYLASDIGSFTAAPNPVTAGSAVTLTAGGVTDGNPGATISSIAFFLVNPDGTNTLLGTGTKNANGTWTLTFSTAGWATGRYTLLARTTDSLGAVGDPVSLSLQVM
jgi:uncharacterized delta-60 repeat protein